MVKIDLHVSQWICHLDIKGNFQSVNVQNDNLVKSTYIFMYALMTRTIFILFRQKKS